MFEPRDLVSYREGRIVPRFQRGGKFFGGTFSWAFSPGYHMAGFQPAGEALECRMGIGECGMRRTLGTNGTDGTNGTKPTVRSNPLWGWGFFFAYPG
jgi:hypothetical protein